MTNLTEQGKKGELPEGDYYIKRRNGDTLYDNIDSHGVWRSNIDEDIIEVLAKVPSYEEWDKLNNACHELEKETACLTVDNVNLKKWCEEFNALDVAKENTKLKELLKECRKCFEFLTNDNSPWCPDGADTLLVKINQVLGEE